MVLNIKRVTRNISKEDRKEFTDTGDLRILENFLAYIAVPGRRFLLKEAANPDKNAVFVTTEPK